MTEEEKVFAELKRTMAILLNLNTQEMDSIAEISSHLRNDLGIDSVESLDFLSSIEELYKIKISDYEAAKLEKVSDVISIIIKKKTMEK